MTRIQVTQETGKMVWYSLHSQNFPQFVMIHTVKGFSAVNETEIDVFLKYPCFLYHPANVGNLISSSSSFSKPSLDIWKFLVHIMLKPSMTLLTWEMSPVVRWLAYSLVLPFLGSGMRIYFFQSSGHCSVFQIW